MNPTTELLDPLDGDDNAPGLDVAVPSLLAIHRDHLGYIGFVRKPDPAHPVLDRHGKPRQFENLFSIRADELQEMFPQLASWLTQDSYATVNAYYRPAPYPNKQTGLPDVWRKEEDLRTLTACYSDIDCGRPGSDEPGAALPWRQAQHIAEYLADHGIIPQPSIMARSGRGVYLLWLLDLPHAWPETIQLYKQINRAINERLREHLLPADRAAIDAARVLRVPGSMHSKAGRRVSYVVQLDHRGHGFVYTLDELAAFVNLDAPAGELPAATRAHALPVQYRRTKIKGSAPRRREGRLQLNALRAQDLLVIENFRGGFRKRGEKYPKDGTTSCGRRFVLTLYTNFLRGSDTPKREALDAVKTMAANMHPRYPSDGPLDDPPVEQLVDEEYAQPTYRRWNNEKLLNLLSINAPTALLLDLKTIRPKEVQDKADQDLPHQRELIRRRREWLKDHLENGGKPIARKVAKAYKSAGFIGANPQTANLDLNALGYKTRKPGRPRKALQ